MGSYQIIGETKLGSRYGSTKTYMVDMDTCMDFLDTSENTDLGKGEAEGDRKINGDGKEYSYFYGTNNICINIRKYCSINIVLMIRES